MKKKNKRAMVAYYSGILFNTFRNIDMAHFIPLDNKMQKLIVGIEPIQDLHGYDNPWPAGGGKNKFEITQGTGTVGDVTFSVIVDDGNVIGLKASGNISANANIVVATANISEAGDYLFSGLTAGSSSTVVVQLRDSSDNILSTRATDESVNITLSVGTYTCVLRVINGATLSDIEVKPMLRLASSESGYSPYSNICPISGHANVDVIVSPTINPSDGTTYPIPLGQTVYGGTLDVLTGVLTVTWKSADMGDFPWVLRNNNQNRQAWKTDVSDMKFVPNGYPNPPPLLCEIFKTIVPNTIWRMYEITYYDGQLNAMVAPNEYADAEEFTTAMSGVQLVYEIATPLTYQLTPTQINTIVGSWNYVWCDSGKIIEIEA